MTKTVFSILALGLAVLSHGEVRSRFDSNGEGWGKIEFTPAGNVFSAPGAVTYIASGGNPGGAIRQTDATGTWMCFDAPSGYFGDLSSAAGGEVGFDVSMTTTLGLNPDLPFSVAITGSAGSIYCLHPVRAFAPWQRVRVKLAGGRDWRWNSYNGAAATPAQVLSVLSSVNRVAIMADYQSGTDTCQIDNVYLGPAEGSSKTLLSFDSDSEGVIRHTSLAGSYTSSVLTQTLATWGASIGKTGGGLTIGDPDAELSWFLLPGTFGGDRTAYTGGVLTYDLKNIPGSGTPIGNYPLLTITSGGKTLVYAPEELNGYNSHSQWEKVAIPFLPGPGWRVGSPTGPVASAAEFDEIAGFVEYIRLRAEYWNGDENNYFDNVLFSPPQPTQVTGHVDLGADYFGSYDGVPIEIYTYRNGFPLAVIPAVLDANGDYSVTITTPGDVTVLVKPSHWLRAIAGTASIDGVAKVLPTVEPLNGDVDEDNAITIFDYLLLSSAFDTSEGQGSWVPNADLDGDGTVTVFDYLILSANFDQVGD
ncbi:MAG: hypothetical protein JST40_10570 [Armatimonadetes bacterium]|nr:hypothetical protein [Armatimonadota bacterium]